MASDAQTTIRSLALEEVLSEIVYLRVLFDPEHLTKPQPAIPLGRQAFAVGRAIEDRGLSIRDPRASRRHAVFRTEEGSTRVVVEDSSSNGTFVNGERITGPTPLGDNDLVRIGDSFLLVRHASPAPAADPEFPAITGRHPAMRALRRTIESVAPTDARVLVIGETGTGKELVARAIHQRSGRTGRFVAVNCSAIAESLAESQLFGHVAGAFTGAQASHDGFMRAAEGGTLFLDEVGELSPILQPKLLRALEESAVTPVGSTTPVPFDVRFVAATHRNLIAEIDAGRFRGDLYARIAGYLVHTLPLRFRREDVLSLLTHFLPPDSPPPSADLVEALLLHGYRFNVRELKEIVTQLAIDAVGLAVLPLSAVKMRLERNSPSAPPPAPLASPVASAPKPKVPPPTKEELERLMVAHRHNISRVARALGRSRRQIYRYLEQYGIEAEG